jgi:hypothetical protein
MNFADIIANANLQNNSRYFESGVYLVEIDQCKTFLNRRHEPRIGIDCTVIDSNNPNFPKTTQMSWVVPLNTDSGPATVKTFIKDITGCSLEEASNSAYITQIFPQEGSANSILVGEQAIVTAHEKPTKKGGVYTKLVWKHFDAKKDVAPDIRDIPWTPSMESNSMQNNAVNQNQAQFGNQNQAQFGTQNQAQFGNQNQAQFNGQNSDPIPF